MTITRGKLESLKSAAKAATIGRCYPMEYKADSITDLAREVGRMFVQGRLVMHWIWTSDHKAGVAPIMTGNNRSSRANAEFISAANPVVVLELIAEIERLSGNKL